MEEFAEIDPVIRGISDGDFRAIQAYSWRPVDSSANLTFPLRAE
jgi:hypothetical protein